MKKIISMFVAANIALASSILPVFAADADIDNLVFSGENNTLTWDKVGTDYAGANVYKYNTNGSLQKLGYTSGNSYTYPENGTYIVRPVMSDNTELEGKVITTVAPENLINISKIHLSQQGVYTIIVENITGH